MGIVLVALVYIYAMIIAYVIGAVFSVAVVVWLIVLLVKYFRNRRKK